MSYLFLWLGTQNELSYQENYIVYCLWWREKSLHTGMSSNNTRILWKKLRIAEKENERSLKTCELCQIMQISLYTPNHFTLNIVLTFSSLCKFKRICVWEAIHICFGNCPFTINKLRKFVSIKWLPCIFFSIK